MDENDIETFMKAKKEQRAADLMSAASVLVLALLMFIDRTGIGRDYSPVLMLLMFGLLVFAQGPSLWVSVSRRELVSIIQRQIQRDPAAINVLSQKNEPPGYQA